MAASKRKQDEKHLKMLREMVALPHNKQCFDCHQRGPTYVNMTIGSFVCTSCSGILRGLNPPHRVKSISMTTFSPEEMEFLKTRGNEYCRRVWLGLYASQALIEPESKDEQKIKDFMGQKYEKKRWYVQPNEAFKTPPQTQPTNTQLPHQNNRQMPETKPLQTLLGQNTPNLVVQNNQITRRLRTSFESPQQGRSLLSQPFPSPTSSISQHSPGQQPSNKPARSLDLLAEFDTNPFGGPPQSQNNANASFANFDDQSAFSMPAQVPSRSNQSTTNNQFTAFTVATPVSTPSTSASTTWASRTDRYAALADLDTLMSSNNSTGTTWDNSSTNWNATSSSVTGFGSTPTSNAPSIFSTVSSNPFTNTTSTWSQQGHIATANPFQIGNTSALGNGMAQGAGFGQFPANTQQTAFGHFGQSSSFGQFGTTTTPTNSTAGFGMNQFGAQNGGFPLSQSPTNWASGGWGMTQTTTSPFGMGNQAAFGGPINAFQPALGKMDLTGQPGVGQYGNWSTQPSPQAAGNPFMAGSQIPPRSNTSNPFL